MPENRGGVTLSLVNPPCSSIYRKTSIEPDAEGTRLYSKWPRPTVVGRSYSKEVLIELFDTDGTPLHADKAWYGSRHLVLSRRTKALTLSRTFPVSMNDLSEVRITFHRTYTP
jgi:hypothetical protein